MAPVGNASFHAVQRRLATLLPDAAIVDGGAALELGRRFSQDKPTLQPPELLEGKANVARPVPGAPTARFAGFLDGTQASRVAQYVGGVPIVHATVAAVVRERRNRRMSTWKRPLVERRLYAPFALLSASARAALAETGVEVVDTTAKRELDSIHPFVIQEAALQAVDRDRSTLERRLAEAWLDRGDGEGELLMDGGIAESERAASSPLLVGVVKSHQQMRVHGDDLTTIFALQPGERSSVVRVTSRRQAPVASWYLRLRDTAGKDPLWGLVRVEIAEPKASSRAITERADEVSRWVLAETLPLAVPDGRWDKMVYGIRDCEEFLRAIQ
jgi:hypothetical protein